MVPILIGVYGGNSTPLYYPYDLNMAKAKIDAPDIPDPLRNIEASEVIQILRHPFLRSPDDIEEEAWKAGIDKVRTAVRALKLDVPIPQTKKILVLVCPIVDETVKAAKNVENDILDDPVVNAIRRRIGLFIHVRVALGRHPQFERLKAEIRKGKGRISIYELSKLKEKNVSNVVNVIQRTIHDYGETAEEKKAVADIIQEFLAKQTGLSSVELTGIRFKDSVALRRQNTFGSDIAGTADSAEPSAPKKSFKKSLKKLGIELPYQAEVDDALRTAEKLHQKLIAAIDERIRAIDELVRNIDAEIKRAETEIIHMEPQYDKMSGQLEEYDEELKKLDEAAKDLLESLIRTGALPEGSTELSMNSARRVAGAKKRLAASFLEPLSRRDTIGKSIEAADRDSKILERTRKKLIAERARLVKIRKSLEGAKGATAAPKETAPRDAGGMTAAPAPAFAPASPAPAPAPRATSGAVLPKRSLRTSLNDDGGDGGGDDDERVAHIAAIRAAAARLKEERNHDASVGSDKGVDDDDLPNIAAGSGEAADEPEDDFDAEGDERPEGEFRDDEREEEESVGDADENAKPEQGQITDYDVLRDLTGNVVFAKVTERNMAILRGKGPKDMEIGSYVPFKVQRSTSSAKEVALHPLTASDRSAVDIIPSREQSSQLSVLTFCLFQHKPKKPGIKGAPERKGKGGKRKK